MIEILSDWTVLIPGSVLLSGLVFGAWIVDLEDRDFVFYAYECILAGLLVAIIALACMSPVHTDEYAICDIDYSDGLLFIDGCNSNAVYRTSNQAAAVAAWTAEPGDLVFVKVRDRPLGLPQEYVSIEVIKH